ncbi:MAG: SUMF1/EgtB/PvdO family nonheme iron enzyme [Lentisphaeria bacterium]|nr:SUMF1/EgtB/PvdO family nonheme iron enzyme [Lentisphaeria bacterium]
MNSEINNKESVILVIDVASTGVSCAIYDTLMKVPHLVPFEQEGLDYIPSVVYIPDNEITNSAFGVKALQSVDREYQGVIYDIEKVLSSDVEYVDLEDRPPYSTQKIAANLFKSIKKEVEEKQLNASAIENCIIITNDNINCTQLLKKAAQINQFKNIKMINRKQAIVNFWNYSHTDYDYNGLDSLLILDIGYSKIEISIVSKGHSQEFVATRDSLKTTLDFGLIDFSNIIWDNLIEQNLIETSNFISLNSPAEKLQATDESLQDMIYDGEDCMYFGKVVSIPRITLTKCRKIFNQQLKDLLQPALLEETLGYDIGKISLIVSGIGTLKEHIKDVIIESYSGLVNIPPNSSFAAVFGGAYLGIDPAEVRRIDPNQAIELASGSQLGLYTILRKVGSGGMGDVWLAHHRTLDQKVAIKVLHTKLTQSSDSVERFLAEIRNTAKLQHPNIVRAHDAGYLNGIYYLVSDFIRGSELSEMMNKNGGALAELDVLHIAHDIAGALKYAWDKHKILHRDIKPDNIMLDYEDSKAMLMDMGISKSLLEDKSGLTTENTMLGTPHYMCPEQISGDKADFRSDIYSLGATLFHCLTGEKPYNADSIINIAMKHLTDPIPSVLDFDSKLSPETDQMLQKMMAKKPEHRQEDWQEVIDQLEKIIYLKTTSEERLEDEKKIRQSDLVVKLITFAAATMSVLLAIFVIFGSSEAQKQVKITYGQVVDVALRIKPEKATITLVNKLSNLDCKIKNTAVSRHSLSGVKTGKYTAIIKAEGFKTITKDVIIGDEDNIFVYELEPLVGSVTIQTTPGAILKVINKKGVTKRIGSTDVTGEFWLNLNEGTYQLEISKALYRTETLALHISSKKKPVIKRKLGLKPGNIIFKSDLSCEIFKANEKLGMTNVVIENMKTGKHTLTVKRKGYIDQTLNITVTDLPSKPINVPEPTLKMGKFTINLIKPAGEILEKFLPEEASIRINKGEWFRISLPYTSNLRRAEVVSLDIAMDDFDILDSAQSFKVKNAENIAVDIKYQLKNGSVVIKNADNLEVFIDNKYVGKTGYVIPVKSYINHKIEVRKEGSRSHIFNVSLEPNQVKRLELPKMISIKSALTISISPKDNQQDLDNKGPKQVSIRIGKDKAWTLAEMPLSIEKISCKEYKISVKAKNFVIYPPFQKVNVLENKLNEVNFTWAPKEIPFTINANVQDARVYINGKYECKIGQEFMLTPYYNHNVIIEAANHGKLAFNLSIKKRDKYKKNITVYLKRLKGIIIGTDFQPSLAGLKMIYLKPNKFTMGSHYGLNTEKPAHLVSLDSGFWMSDSEITQLQFIEIMKYNPSLFIDQQKPVERVSWEEAMNFCEKLTEKQRKLGILNPKDYFTLPTEAEWEYACKGGTTSQFNTGNDLTSKMANFDGNYSFVGKRGGQFRKQTTKVKSFKSNEFHLFDMHGNVAEWCLDGYVFSYKNKAQINPVMNPKGQSKVVRGGSWKSYPRYCRSSSRSNKQFTSKSPTIGFRVVLKIVE